MLSDGEARALQTLAKNPNAQVDPTTLASLAEKRFVVQLLHDGNRLLPEGKKALANFLQSKAGKETIGGGTRI